MTGTARAARLLAAAVLVAIGMCASGCAPLPAYRRSALMQRCMTQPVDPQAASFETHIHRTREAMIGATAHGGPSCGCN